MDDLQVIPCPFSLPWPSPRQQVCGEVSETHGFPSASLTYHDISRGFRGPCSHRQHTKPFEEDTNDYGDVDGDDIDDV